MSATLPPSQAPSKPRLRGTRHALPAETRAKMVDLLDERLADALDLRSRAKHAHWNARGPAFYSLHLLFDSLAKTLDAHADALAERVASLGGVAHGTLRMTARSTTLPGPTSEAETDHLEDLIASFAVHGKNLGKAIAHADALGDRGSADLLTEHIRDVDEALFLLEAHVREV